MSKKRRMYHLDMDGTLVRWNENATEEDTHVDGYFLAQTADPFMIEIVNELVARGENVDIYTHAYTEGTAKEDKIQWLKRQGLDLPVVVVPYGTPKTEFIPQEPGIVHVLVDDYSKNLREWRKAGNVAVKYLNGINGNNGTWKGPSINGGMTVDNATGIILSAGLSELEFVRFLAEEIRLHDRSMEEVRQFIHYWVSGFAPRATENGLEILKKDIMVNLSAEF